MAICEGLDCFLSATVRNICVESDGLEVVKFFNRVHADFSEVSFFIEEACLIALYVGTIYFYCESKP